MLRHQSGVPLSPTSRAVSAGTLCTATSCCCSPTALRKPSAWLPKPISAIAPSTTSPIAAPASACSRSRGDRAPSTRNGSARPAVTLIATPATSVADVARIRGLAPALSSSAAASASMISVSLCAPPTARTSKIGFSPTNAAAQRVECPSRPAARAVSATAARLETTAIALNAHRLPARPSGAVA
jgi:hypothetical protein